MEPGQNGECNGGGQRPPPEQQDPEGLPELAKQNRGHRDDLGDRVEFAQDAGLEIANAGGGIKHRRNHQYTEIARENENCDA